MSSVPRCVVSTGPGPGSVQEALQVLLASPLGEIPGLLWVLRGGSLIGVQNQNTSVFSGWGGNPAFRTSGGEQLG